MTVGNFVEGARTTTADATAVWSVLIDVDRWPDTFTPHLAAGVT